MSRDAQAAAASRKVRVPAAAAPRNRLQGRERGAAHLAKELAMLIESARPGSLHSLNITAAKGRLHMSLVFDKNRLRAEPVEDEAMSVSSGSDDAGTRQKKRHVARQQPTVAASRPAAAPPHRKPKPAGQTVTPAARHAPASVPDSRSVSKVRASAAPAAAPKPQGRGVAAVEAASEAARATAEAYIAQMEADEPGQPPGPPFCHPPPPRPSGRPPKEPRSEVGRLVQYLKEGVAAVAPEVDGGCFDASDYTTGKFSLKGEVSQDITIPDGSRLASALTRGSEAAGEEISKAIMRVRPYCGLSRSMAQRELLLPRALVDADT